MIKKLVKSLLNRLGYDLVRFRQPEKPQSVYSDLSRSNENITDIEKLAEGSLSVPGMIEPRSGQNLYQLCYLQSRPGDVVEIGSWQGRSTIFLASAVRDSGNGRLYAIDHFKGNVGKEDFYRVEGSLENLDEKFLKNVATFGLSDYVRLLDMPSAEAAEALGDISIRFLFIDGDHTYDGVKNDIELFFPRLTEGAIVVFDDYFDGFPGLVQAVEECVIEKNIYSKIYQYRHTLVIETK